MRKLLSSLFITLTPSLASAHVGIGDSQGAAHGFLHPLTGVDHLLAMVAVGMFAVNLGGPAIWLVPLAFCGTMAFGGVLGMIHVPLPLVEPGIGLSVVTLGLVVALLARPPLPVAMALVAFFALFHGHAHGAEMPESASGFAYAAGFVVATACLHVTGVLFGMAIGGRRKPWLAGLVGGAMALVGVAILGGAL